MSLSVHTTLGIIFFAHMGVLHLLDFSDRTSGTGMCRQGEVPFQVMNVRLLTLNYARGMCRRERGVKVQGATSCAGRQESLVVLEVRGRGWDR